MSPNAGKTVGEILRGKNGGVKNAALGPGAPSWDEILPVLGEDVEKRARQNRPGYKTIKKLLSSGGVRQMKVDGLNQVLDLLRRFDEAKVPHRLYQVREDALMIEVAIPGQRWEIEFVAYEDEFQVEVERFVSDGHIDDESAIAELFALWSEEPNPAATVANHDDAARK